MHKLVISDDEGKTTVVPLVRDEITIGRKEGNTIRLTERNVSRRHARLKKANGAYLLEDLESYNGIKVNGRRIEKELELKLGDQVGIGDYMIALQDEVVDATAVAEAPTAAITPPRPHPPIADSPTAMIAAPAAPVAAAPPARLVMISPPAPGAEFAFQRPKMRIGRAEDLDICVNHRSISREHAELVREGDKIRLVDLGSANGTRVNGKDVTDAVLAAGDVLELGQVRFRYVGEGEAYHFDAERTVQMDALVMPTSTSKLPIMIGAGIVGLALVTTIIVIAASGGGGPPDDITATAVPTIETGPPPVALANVAPSASDVDYMAALAACQQALQAGEYDRARDSARAALRLRSGDADALRCEREVNEAIEQLAAVDAQVLLARAQAEALRAAAPHPPAGAGGGTRPVGGGNNTVAVRPAGGGGNNTVAVRPAGGGGTRPPGGGGTAPPPGGGGTTRPPGGGGTQVAAAGGGGATRPPLGGGPDTGAADRLERARQLMLQGNNNGVIALLQGARSQQELELLIATYTNVGNTPAKLAAMQRYIDRFPTTPRARQYQQVLLRQQ